MNLWRTVLLPRGQGPAGRSGQLRPKEHQTACLRCAQRPDGYEHYIQRQKGDPLDRIAHEFGAGACWRVVLFLVT